jgi:hypothetical protein
MFHGACGGCVLLAGMTLLSGCNILAIGAYYLRPRDIQKAEYALPPGSRVAFFVEAERPEMENPVFRRALHEQLVTSLREGKCDAQLIPAAQLDEVRARPELKGWSVQRIGQELAADYVLYARVERFQLRELPEHPLITPEVELRMRLIGVQEPKDAARVWPDEPDGRLVSCKRQAVEAVDPDIQDAEAGKLGRDTAYWVSMPFIDVDLEERPPVAR